MSRGIRGSTHDRVGAARKRNPLAMGPIMGELAIHQNIPASLLAEMINTHVQTVQRWMFGQSEVKDHWLPVVMRVITLLVWRNNTNALPLAGTLEEKRSTLEGDAADFREAVKASRRAA